MILPPQGHVLPCDRINRSPFLLIGFLDLLFAPDHADSLGPFLDYQRSRPTSEFSTVDLGSFIKREKKERDSSWKKMPVTLKNRRTDRTTPLFWLHLRHSSDLYF